jgi:D-xylose transport system permease protein
MASTTTTVQPQREASGLARQFRANLQTYGLIGALILITIFFSVQTNGAFIGARNFSNLFRQMTVTGFLSVGMVLVIVTGNIDLSVGKLAGFVSVVVAVFQARLWPQYLPNADPFVTTTLSVIVGILVGTIVGVIQGYIIAFHRVPAFIVTLGGLWVFTGLILIVTEGKTIPANQPLFSQISQGYLPREIGWVIAVAVIIALFASMFLSRQRKAKYGFDLAPVYLDVAKTLFFSAIVVAYVFVVNQYNGVQLPVLLLAIVSIVVAYMSNNTRFGRYAYAIGGNPEAARLSGVNIRNNIFSIFVLMGLLCGVSGVALASYVGYGTTAAGQGYELDAIAACILGGTSTLGGEGTILGAMVGALIMASLTNGLQMMNVASEWQYVLKGIVLVIAVFADVRLRRNR